MTTAGDARLHILQHSLGLNEHGQGRAYRNHFETGPGSTDHAHCMALVESGLMARGVGSALTGGDDLFTVTEAGRAFVAENSPPPPPSKNGYAQRNAEIQRLRAAMVSAMDDADTSADDHNITSATLRKTLRDIAKSLKAALEKK